MSFYESSCLIMGRVTKTPEIKYTGDGTPVAKISVAVNKTTGKGEKRTSFFDVIAWRKNAEVASQRLEKGQWVKIQAEIEQKTWGEGENRKTRYEFTAIRIGLGPKAQAKTGAGSQQESQEEEFVPERTDNEEEVFG